MEPTLTASPSLTSSQRDEDGKRKIASSQDEAELNRHLMHEISRAKSKSKVLKPKVNSLGERIYKGHPSWQLMSNIQTGIRHSVGKSTTVISNDDIDKVQSFNKTAEFFKSPKTLKFPSEGSSETQPHKTEPFKFKDYCPSVFRHLRQKFNIDPADYLVSLCHSTEDGSNALRELPTPGKSGSLFLFSHDMKYILKTIPKREAKLLRELLPHYYAHVMENSNTLLPKFFGLHRVKPHGGRQVRFVIMENVFATNRTIHERYDVKGSTVGRAVSEEEKMKLKDNVTYKDVDWLLKEKRLHLSDKIRNQFLDQLKQDCQFLERMSIMDYSLLIGVHICSKNEGDDCVGACFEAADNRKRIDELRAIARKESIGNFLNSGSITIPSQRLRQSISFMPVSGTSSNPPITSSPSQTTATAPVGTTTVVTTTTTHVTDTQTAVEQETTPVKKEKKDKKDKKRKKEKKEGEVTAEASPTEDGNSKVVIEDTTVVSTTKTVVTTTTNENNDHVIQATTEEKKSEVHTNGHAKDHETKATEEKPTGDNATTHEVAKTSVTNGHTEKSTSVDEVHVHFKEDEKESNGQKSVKDMKSDSVISETSRRSTDANGSRNSEVSSSPFPFGLFGKSRRASNATPLTEADGNGTIGKTKSFIQSDHPLPDQYKTPISVFQQDDGGVMAVDAKGNPLAEHYYVAIIDILMLYTTRKKLEHAYKAIRYNADEISSVRPELYAHRFVNFVRESVTLSSESIRKYSTSNLKDKGKDEKEKEKEKKNSSTRT